MGFGIGEILLLLMFIFFGGLFQVLMVLDCLRYERTGSDEKIYWLFVIVLLGPLGAGVYYFVRRRSR